MAGTSPSRAVREPDAGRDPGRSGKLDAGRREHALEILRAKLGSPNAPFPVQMAVADALTELDDSDPGRNESTLRILLEAFAGRASLLDTGQLVRDIANRLVRFWAEGVVMNRRGSPNQ